MRAGFDTKIQDVEMKASLAVDKERLLRVQGGKKFQSEATSARETLRVDILHTVPVGCDTAGPGSLFPEAED